MVRTTSSNANSGPQRYKSASRKVLKSRVRKVWRRSALRVYVKKTRQEKKAIREKNRGRREDYSEALRLAQKLIHDQAVLLHEHFQTHCVEWYIQEIAQHSRITKGRRKVNGWNVFLSTEAKHINDSHAGVYTLFIFRHFLTEFLAESGGERKKINALAPEISARWHAMSYDEQKAATEDHTMEIENRRETQALSRKNIPLSAFNNTKHTLESIEYEVLFFTNGLVYKL